MPQCQSKRADIHQRIVDIAAWFIDKKLSEQYDLDNGATPYDDYANLMFMANGMVMTT